MRLRIRAKFIGILIIAAVLPVVLALITAQLLGYRYYRGAQGERFETMARYLANNLSLAINKQLEDLDEWVALSDLHVLVRAVKPLSGKGIPTEPDARAAWLEEHWNAFPASEPPLRTLLENPISQRLIAFRMVNPMFAEIFVTDSRGEIVGTTAKTSDYLQADEKWWQQAAALPLRNAYVEGLEFDASAGVYSIVVAYPIYDLSEPAGRPIGVIKGVIDATPRLSSLATADPSDEAVRQVVLGSGEILVRLSGEKVQPLARQITTAAAATIVRRRSGWLIADLGETSQDLIGFSALTLLNTVPEPDASVRHALFVLVSLPVREALAPVRQQMYIVGTIGGLLVLAFACAGYFVAGRKIIDPIEHLRTAVRSVALSVRRDPSPMTGTRQDNALAKLQKVKTGDELEALAKDFAFMAEKVSGYHQELEREIDLKTAELLRDLEMAREFQEALMPRTYPAIPANPADAPLALAFHHIYRPASSVGGDFFDILPLSGTKAGIFIADVMGHGTRSALVTAILRTMLQDLSAQTDDPAEFLALINNHFHQIASQSRELIFVSAFYMVIDTAAGQASFASAGHPAPFLADRERRRVDPLIENLRGNPALGLLPHSTYQKWTKQVMAGDVFVLFTDGLPEATNESGEEFGEERVRQTVIREMGHDPETIDRALLAEVNRFIGVLPLPDDICLLTIEVTPSQREARPRPHQPSLASGVAGS